MPLESMTGFSCSKIFIDGNEISCEIRSVNSKFLDVKFKALDQSNIFEAFALNLAKKMFSRGNIEIKLSNFDRIAQKISINQTLLKSLRVELKGNQLLNQKLNFSDIKDIPGIFVIDSKPHRVSIIKRLINNAIHELKDARLLEGRALRGIILLKHKKLVKIRESISKMVPLLNKKRAQKLKKKFTKIHSFTNAEILSEASNHIIKHDISEELERISFHLNEVHKLLKKRHDHGKRLDILLQELLREMNTLSVKVDNIKIKKLAIDGRILIEELREQAQNIQ